MSGIRVVDRDYMILREIDRWRVVTGRHICGLVGFGGQRACDRRLRKLIDAEILQRKKVFYGFPSIYSLTVNGQTMLGIPKKAEKLRVEQIPHDMAVTDTAIYFNHRYGIPFSNMTTEKQLHQRDGFSVRKHRPDFIFQWREKTYCVEVELSLKSFDRFSKNITDNFTAYDGQFWIVPSSGSRIASHLLSMRQSYPNIKIIELSEVKSYESC